jgi:hypothetical protein
MCQICRTTQQKVIDTEVEEKQNVQINGLHDTSPPVFYYSTGGVKMLSKAETPAVENFFQKPLDKIRKIVYYVDSALIHTKRQRV